ncbi:hypothetical protein ABG067_006808 [Albugo candida]
MVQVSVTTSSFLQEITAANQHFQSAHTFANSFTLEYQSTITYYRLTEEEIEDLKQKNNTAENWNQILKLSDAKLRVDRIQSCSFHGFVVLGDFGSSCEMVDGVRFPSGCYNSAISHSIILDDALIRDTILLHHTLLQPKAIVIRCGILGNKSDTQTTKHTFGNGLRINLGAETGGRNLTIVADLTFELAAILTEKGGIEHDELQKSYTKQTEEYMSVFDPSVSRIIIGEGAQVLFCSRLEGCFIGSRAVVENSALYNVTLLSNEKEPSSISGNSIVRDSIVQWNSTIESMSFVERCLLCDSCRVERKGIVKDSVLGPNSCIAEGEVTSSLVGPFVGFHHQSLLIAAIWPQGRGNVAYGANIGSNHTLRLPDQELFPGEGMFFGLGVNIKYPTNFIQAPYSVIASGVCTHPQRMEFPFSLIGAPRQILEGLSPALNEISPGWVLKHSLFTILRAQTKFKTRNKSERMKKASTEILYNRADLVSIMKTARERLQHAPAKLTAPKHFYTNATVPGLGSNYMTEKSRVSAINTYTYFIRLCALEALLRLLELNGPLMGNIRSIGTFMASKPKMSSSDSELLAVLVSEFKNETFVGDCLQELGVKSDEIARQVENEIKRDEARGLEIIPSYTAVHTAADKEKTVEDAYR